MQSLGSEPLQFVPIVTVRFHCVVACTQDAKPPTGAALTPGFLRDLAYRSMELQAKATCDVTLVVLDVLCRPRRRPNMRAMLRRRPNMRAKCCGMRARETPDMGGKT